MAFNGSIAIKWANAKLKIGYLGYITADIMMKFV